MENTFFFFIKYYWKKREQYTSMSNSKMFWKMTMYRWFPGGKYTDYLPL